MDAVENFVTKLLPILFFVGLYAVIVAFLLKLFAEILYSAVLAGIQMFPWARDRWGRRGIVTLSIGWIFLAPAMIAVCLVLGAMFGVFFVLRSRKTARELDKLYLRYLMRRNSISQQKTGISTTSRQ